MNFWPVKKILTNARIKNTEPRNSKFYRRERESIPQYDEATKNETRLTNKIKRNTAKAAVRQTHHEAWDRLIDTVEHGVYRRQTLAHKRLNHLNSQERDVANVYRITEVEWI